MFTQIETSALGIASDRRAMGPTHVLSYHIIKLAY